MIRAGGSSEVSGVLTKSRVLIVDDDADFADSTAEILEANGFQVRAAYSSTSALQLLEDFDPHVALVDLRLGVESGTELIERMRAQRANIVCILMTAYAALDTAIEALRNRADDYLRKPLQPQGMLDVIRRAVQRVREVNIAERRERLASVGSLAAGVAHDLNNILTIVISETELLERQCPEAGESVRSGLRVLHESAVRASQITHNLLLIARGAPAENPCLHPHQVLREVATAVERSLPAGVSMACELEEEDLALAIGASQLYQVALNLLVNARDAIPHAGSVLLRSRIAPPPAAIAHAKGAQPERPPGLLVSVTDTGMGIDAPTMQRLFEPFFSTKTSGSGLGLATSYGLVSACGGEMLVESKLGVGSEFSVWIPSALQRSSVPPAQPRGLAPTPPPGTAVLLCDDDPMVLQALSRVLRDLGHEVSHAVSMEEAVERWQAEPQRFSMVVTDMRLGKARGIDLARKVLAERADVHVVLMSGDLTGVNMRDPIWTRVTHLQKPFNRAALCAAIGHTAATHED